MTAATEPAKNTVKRTDWRGRAVFKFEFTQALSGIQCIGKTLEAFGQIQ